MRCLTTGSTGGMDSFSKIDINPSYAKKTPICWNWFGIFSGELFGSTGRKGGKGKGLPTGIAEILNFKVVPLPV
jgi:hypothetical protein